MKTASDRIAALLAWFSAWLTPRRIRAQALALALCLWGVCAIDYATPGLFDRAGNIKFQDFLQFPVVAQLIAQDRTREIYDDQLLADGIREIVGPETSVHLQYFYGPQVALPFVPFIRLSFLPEACIWIAFSVLIYFVCVYLLWKTCSALAPHRGLVFFCALAYPPLFHFFVRGQLSAMVLLCFTLTWLAFRARQDFLAGIVLGLLAFKPQFLVAIPIVLLMAQAWKLFAGVAISAGAQLAFAFFYFGPVIMRSYIDTLLHSASRPGTAELSLSPIQMHSLRTFWALLIPSPSAVWILYIFSSLAVIALAVSVWKSSPSPALRFSALLLAAVLLNPHIYIYDLLALAPVFLLLADCTLIDPQNTSTPALRVLLYLAFILPLLGPLSRWTHLQLSVPVFAVLLWIVSRRAIKSPTVGHTLATPDSRVV